LAFFKVSCESFGVVAVVALDELMDAPSGILSFGGNFAEAPDMSDAAPFAVRVG
jgi:hypothetical protein